MDLLTLALAALLGNSPGPANLLRSPGLEEGAAAWALPRGYAVAADVARTGAASLRAERSDPKEYLLGMQEVACRPGRQYRFGAWVRTRGVVGDGGGAAVCLEWSGPDGYIGGSYVDGPKGDTDWTRLEGIGGPIPRGATRVTLTLYLRPGNTGHAWFDDAWVTEYVKPFAAHLLEPAYRGTLWPDNPAKRVLARADVSETIAGVPAARVRVRVTVSAGARSLARVDRRAAGPGPLDVWVDTRALPPGAYTVRATAHGPGGRALAAGAPATLTMPARGARRPAVMVDHLGRTLVAGKPFFPLGLYFGPGPTDGDYAAHLDRVAAAGFNVVMPYGINSGSLAAVRAYLDALHARGLKILYSIKDVYEGTQWYEPEVLGWRGEDGIVRGTVGAFRGHPALLGWYLNDELPLTMGDRLVARYGLVRRLDPDHPTWSVLYQVDQMAGYLGTADVLGSDPYPVGRSPLTMAADWVRMTNGAGGGRRAIWQVPQVFDHAVYDEKGATPRAPTLDEMLVMTYLALIEGADGLIYYSYFDLQRDRAGFERRWADVATVARDVKALEPALLCTRPLPEVAVRASRREVRVRVLSRPSGGAVVLLANPADVAARAEVAVPPGSPLRLMRRGSTAPVAPPARGSRCIVELPPVGAAALFVGPG